MKAIPASRLLLWLVLGLPGAWMLYRWAATPDAYGFGHAIGDSGLWAAWLLMLTLAVTPLRLLFGRRGWTTWLLRRRRDFGVASFAYGTGHTVIYLADKAALPTILAEASRSELLAGWLALALFVPLAVTSNDKAVRALKRSWKRLHRLVYFAAIAGVMHYWMLVKSDIRLPAYYGLVVAILLAFRLYWARMQDRRKETRAAELRTSATPKEKSA